MNSLFRIRFISTAVTLLICTFFIAQVAYSQEKESSKKVRIKVITVEDGEETTFDTTFNSEDFNKEAFQKEMKDKYGIELEEPDSVEMTENVYIICTDGEKFTIKEGGKENKVIRIVTEEGEQKVIKEEDGKKVILITEEGETKVIKGEEGEKVIMIKVDEDKCDKAKKDKKGKEKTIKVMVITEDEGEEPEKK